MHVVVAFLLGVLVGAGLTYAFRGAIAREKAKELAALQAAAQKAEQKL